MKTFKDFIEELKRSIIVPHKYSCICCLGRENTIDKLAEEYKHLEETKAVHIVGLE